MFVHIHMIPRILMLITNTLLNLLSKVESAFLQVKSILSIKVLELIVQKDGCHSVEVATSTIQLLWILTQPIKNAKTTSKALCPALKKVWLSDFTFRWLTLFHRFIDYFLGRLWIFLWSIIFPRWPDPWTKSRYDANRINVDRFKSHGAKK